MALYLHKVLHYFISFGYLYFPIFSCKYLLYFFYSFTQATHIFCPTPPQTEGQLYNDLPEGHINLSKTIFSVNGFELSHLILKSLESNPSIKDKNTIKKFQKWHALQNSYPLKEFTPGWLIDYIIDAFSSILVELHDCVFAISSSATEMMYRSINPPRPSKNRLTRVPKTVNYILMPYNPSSIHWTLLVLDIKNDLMLHFDSLKDPNSLSDGEGIIEEKHKEQLKLSLNAWYAIDWSGMLVNNVDCLQQTGGINCGIFLLHFSEMIAQGKPLVTPFNPEEYRAKVFKALVEHKGNNKM